MAVALLVTACGPAATLSPRTVTGEFVRWDPVDDRRGYMVFTLTNNGTRVAEAKCRLMVRNDFGDLDTDRLTGEVVQPGQTITRRVAMTLDSGARLVNRGEVTDC